MFDTIICEKKLPLTKELKSLPIDWKKQDWQTKDLDNCLDVYTITKSGKLLKTVVEGEWSEIKDGETKSFFDSWNFTETKRTKEEISYHGTLLFYSFIDVGNDSWWFDFTAYFTYGKLDKIVLTKTEKQENAALERSNWIKEFSAKQNTLSAKIKKYLNKLGWSTFWVFIANGISKLSRAIEWVRMFILKHII